MAAHQAVDGLPHLADQEYMVVVRSAHQLVKATLTELEIRFPPMRRYTEEHHRRTAEDLFAGFIVRTGAILAARRVPARSLDPALDLLALQLKDFPRGCRTPARARERSVPEERRPSRSPAPESPHEDFVSTLLHSHRRGRDHRPGGPRPRRPRP
ncbi:hypothetical protein [Streptomyces sp. NBC_01558]|uniref:hypothetical protein n=1 Tax=Streptomyces sp. NBC_01558 TaxID=2975878 RepID=UPI002DD87324|nr:hypothetical protein [Streptomyces sp. NBC_01558]